MTCLRHPSSSMLAIIPIFFIYFINFSLSNKVKFDSSASMSEGVTLSSTTSIKLFLGFGCNKLLRLPCGSTSSLLTTQSLTNPPLMTQLNTLVNTQQTAIILPVREYLVDGPLPLAQPLIIWWSSLLSTIWFTLSIILSLSSRAKNWVSSINWGFILNYSLQIVWLSENQRQKL